jgi:hypothetical protein
LVLQDRFITVGKPRKNECLLAQGRSGGESSRLGHSEVNIVKCDLS